MLRRISLFILLFCITRPVQTQSVSPQNAAEIRLSLKKLNVLGSVLYIAAHPDDENTALLAAFTQGRLYRTGYLSLTRGEGGQNLLGPEQGVSLGLIRTQELLAARRIDGAEQYFTRAVDFGFSKSTGETLRFWGKEKILSDIVWVIRSFRPDVIITRFTPTLGGHGNHTASAFLTEEAFHAAADSTRFPEQLRYVSTWQAKRIVWNVFRFGNDTTRKTLPLPSIDLGAYAPLLGKSFTEIAGESRSMHKSQGFGAAQNRGEFLNYFQHIAGDSARKDLFDGVNTTWLRLKDTDSLQKIFDEAYSNFDDERPAQSIPLLFKALQRMESLTQDPWIIHKKEELIRTILACAGVWVEATTTDISGVPGSEVKFTTTVVNRSPYPFILDRIILPLNGSDTTLRKKLESNQLLRTNFTLCLPESLEYTQPYWLREDPQTGSYNVSNQLFIGQAENTPLINITVVLASPDGKLTMSVPLRQRIVDPVDGESFNPFEIVPPVTVNVEEPVILFPDQSVRQIRIMLKSGTENAKGFVRLKLPDLWTAVPAKSEFNLMNKNDEQSISFSIKPLPGAKSGAWTAEAEIGKKIVDCGMQVIKYKHIPPQIFFPRAEGKLLRIDLKHSGRSVGYIMGAGDEVPSALRQMGYVPAMLSDEDLAEGNLDTYNVIVAGVRAYNTRPQLRINQQRMMEYVKRGGTYIVQYMTPQKGETDNIGPYPMNISRDRVAEEDAPVTFLNRNNPLLTTPNRITADDFKDWIQERGLSFADRWDGRYDSVLSCHDTNEPERAGGLLMTKYGKGYFVYCGYAFFRQLPAGVEGAYRLFANMLSLRGGSPRQEKVRNATLQK